MIYCQGLYGWKKCLLECTQCNYSITGLYIDEMGHNYYADATQDMLNEPCPECGATLEEK